MSYFGNSRNHANDDTGRVGRRFYEGVSLFPQIYSGKLTRLDESIRSDNVADCDTYEDDGTSDNLLGGTSHISGNK
jgi:hypothetical protein